MKIFRYRSLWNMIVGHVIIYFWFQLTIFSNMSLIVFYLCRHLMRNLNKFTISSQDLEF